MLLALVPGVLALVGLVVVPRQDDACAGVAAGSAAARAVGPRQVAWTRDRLVEVERATDELESRRASRAELQREPKLAELQADYAATAGGRRASGRARRAERKLRGDDRRAARRVSSPTGSRATTTGSISASPALVRRDFEEMSTAAPGPTRDRGGETSAARKENDELGINRIVLYIDDLDRCPPEKVVAVLQAVHLLLAFPLFVSSSASTRAGSRARCACATGTCSAATTGRRRRRPDYLEKIFQIPFWLEPLDQDATRRMLKGLLPAAAAATPTAASTQVPTQPATDDPAGDGDPGGATDS